MLNIEEIKKIVPQRFPFLMIDRVLEIEENKRLVAIKNVSVGEQFFQGHFPDKKVMPGVLIIEAMAQTSVFIYHSAYEKELTKNPDYFIGSLKANFLHPVLPGDQLKIIAEAVKLIPTGGFVAATAFVRDEEVANAELVFAAKRWIKKE